MLFDWGDDRIDCWDELSTEWMSGCSAMYFDVLKSAVVHFEVFLLYLICH